MVHARSLIYCYALSLYELLQLRPLLQVNLAEPGNPTYLRVFSYCVVFIPSLLVCWGYPLGVHAMVNDIYTVLTGHVIYFFFAIIFFLPTALQLQSIQVCKKTFRRIHVRMCLVQRVSSSVHVSGEDSGRGDDARMANSTQVILCN